MEKYLLDKAVNGPICLNDATGYIPIRIDVSAGSEVVPDVILKYLSSVKIDREIGENSSGNLSFEYSVSHDTFFNDPENPDNFVPPYIAFPSTNVSIKYGISFTYLGNSDYSIKYIKYNLDDKNTKLKTLISNFDRDIKPYLPNPTDKKKDINTNHEEIKKLIENLIKNVKNIENSTLSKQTKKIQEVNKTKDNKSFSLLTANTTVMSFGGSKDGMIKYDITLHQIIDVNDETSKAIENSSTSSTIDTSRNYTTIREMVGIYVDRFILNKEVKLSDFVALLFGKVKVSGSYITSTRSSNGNISTFNAKDAIPVNVNTFNTDASSIINAKSLDDTLKKSGILLDFSQLEAIDFSEIINMQRDSNSNLRAKLNYAYKPTTGTSKFFDSFEEKVLKSKTDNAYGDIITNATKTAINTAFVNTISEFFEKSKKLKTSDLSEYLTMIKTNFNIEFKFNSNITPDLKHQGIKTKIELYKPGITYNSVTPTTTTDAAEIKTQKEEFILLDYGGIVIDFKHSIKTASIKVDKVTGGVAVSQRIADMVSLDLQLDSEKMRQYAFINKDKGILDFGKYILSLAEKDMDSFLNLFTKYVANVKVNNIADPKPEGGKSKGNQNLTLTLKYPIPISEGQLVFFDVVNGKKYDRPGSKAYMEGEQTKTTTYAEIGFYPIPDKVRGIYIVQKVTYEFDAKSGVHKMQLECHR